MTAESAASLLEQIDELLARVRDIAGADFSGVGVIVAPAGIDLPILPLRSSSILDVALPTADALAAISRPEDDRHDGFHLLTPDLRVGLVAQYFSPPIVAGVELNRSRRFGGRYVAALFGSAISSVLATGIASREFGVAVFENGSERSHRPPSAVRPTTMCS